jgi:hypothetical protein
MKLAQLIPKNIETRRQIKSKLLKLKHVFLPNQKPSTKNKIKMKLKVKIMMQS